MIKIVLSEKDFDYEIQALVNSFFPGQKSKVVIDGNDDEDVADIVINISFSMNEISVAVKSDKINTVRTEKVTGEQDYHKHEGKTTHPYRTYYKNILKKLIYTELSGINDEELPDGIVKRIPEWGTMTGVRPTKIAMNELLSGKEISDVRNSLKEVYCCSNDKIELGTDIALREAELLKACNYEDGYSIYVGIPFCPTTCLYCSFTSYPYEKFGYLAEDYLKALKKEIKFISELMSGKKLTSIYIGGGTPTTLTTEQLKSLISYIQMLFPVKDSYEFTIEAGRPDSITMDKLKAMNEMRVHRISVNPQTMQQKTLDLIGRCHTVSQTVEAFKMAREAGFDNINMDLIIGLPGETVEDFEDTLRQIGELDPDSLTIHSLVVKRASRLRSALEEAGEYGEAYGEMEKAERMERMLAIGQEFAAKHGYNPYYMYRQKNSAGHAGSSGQENIGYAKEGKECLYNILIMEEKQTIMAAGAGASTKIYHKELGQVSRIENVKSVHDYIERIDEMIDRKRNELL